MVGLNGGTGATLVGMCDLLHDPSSIGKMMAADVVKTSSATAVSGNTLTIASRDGGVTVIDSVIRPKEE